MGKNFELKRKTTVFKSKIQAIRFQLVVKIQTKMFEVVNTYKKSVTEEN